MRRLFLAFASVVLLTSCINDNATGTLRIQLVNPQYKTITTDPNIYVPVKYVITGTGPGNSSLTIDSTSSLIVRDGVRLGNWTFSATSYNSDSREISQGEGSFELTSDSQINNINLDYIEGSGQAKLSFEWDSTVTEPHIDLEVYSINTKANSTKTINPSSSSTSTNANFSEMPNGSYIVKATLRNSKTTIGTTVEVLNIANDVKTSGTISFSNSASYSQELEKLSIYDSFGTKIKGSLSYDSSTVVTGEETSVSLCLDSIYDIDDFVISWYLDGTEIKTREALKTTNTVSIIPETGTHFLNAIVINRTTGAAGSATFKFVAQNTGKEGVGTYDSLITSDSDSEVQTDPDTLMSVLPDNKILVLNSKNGLLQLCHVENRTLMLEYSYSSSEPLWEFLDSSTSLHSSPNLNLFAVVDNDVNVNILNYNSKKGIIELAYNGKDLLRFVNGGSDPEMNFSYINVVSVDSNNEGGGNIVASDPNSSRSVCWQTAEDTIITSCSLYENSSYPDTTEFVICEDNIVAISPNSSYMFSAPFDGVGKTGRWEEIITPLNELLFLKKLSDNSVVISDGKKICRFTLSGEHSWVLRGTTTCQIKDIETSHDGKYIYVIDSENKLVTYKLVGTSIVWQGETRLGITPCDILVTNDNIIVRSVNGDIVICSIIKEET